MEITHGRYANLLRRWSAAEGPVSTGFIEEVFPYLPVEATQTEELDLLRGWFRAHQSREEAAVAAEFARFRLRNVADSGIVAVVERLWLNASAAQTLMLEGVTRPAGAALATTASQSSFYDSRPGDGTGSPGGLQLTGGTLGSALSGGRILGVTAATEVVQTELPLVLFPNSSVSFRATVANVTVGLTVQYRYRNAEQSELVAIG